MKTYVFIAKSGDVGIASGVSEQDALAQLERESWSWKLFRSYKIGEKIILTDTNCLKEDWKSL